MNNLQAVWTVYIVLFITLLFISIEAALVLSIATLLLVVIFIVRDVDPLGYSFYDKIFKTKGGKRE